MSSAILPTLFATLFFSLQIGLQSSVAQANTTAWSCRYTPAGSTHRDGPASPEHHDFRPYRLEIQGPRLTFSRGAKMLLAHKEAGSDPGMFFVSRKDNELFEMNGIWAATFYVDEQMIAPTVEIAENVKWTITLTVQPENDACSRSLFVCSPLNY